MEGVGGCDQDPREARVLRIGRIRTGDCVVQRAVRGCGLGESSLGRSLGCMCRIFYFLSVTRDQALRAARRARKHNAARAMSGGGEEGAVGRE